MLGLLKLVLQKSADLDRRLEAFSKNLSHCLERAIDEGLLKVYAYPNPDALVASSLLVSKSLAEGVRASLKISHMPPSIIRSPSVLVGYPSANYKSGEVGECLIAISYEGRLTTPPPGATYVEVDGSLTSALAVSFIAGGWKGSKTLKLLSLVGTYSSPYVDRIGKIHGLDTVLADAISKHGVSMTTTIKVYKPHRIPLCKAISLTLSPYYPALTGDEGECKAVLDSAGLGDLAERIPSTLTSDDLTKVSKVIIDHVEGYSKRKVDPSDYFGGMLTSPEPPEDLRMVSDALLAATEMTGDPSVYLSTFVDFENEYPIVEENLFRLAREIGPEILRVKVRKVKGPGWLRIYAISLTSPPLTLIHKALSLLGFIDSESLLAFSRENDLLLSPLQVEQSLGYGAVRKLVDSKVAVPDEFYLKLSTGGV